MRIVPLLVGLILLALGWMVGCDRDVAGGPAASAPAPADTSSAGRPAFPEREAKTKLRKQSAAAQADSATPPVAGSAVSTSAALDPDVSLDAWRKALREEVRASTSEDYERQRTQARRNDAEAAFWLHLYYYGCRWSPREDWQLDERLASLRRQHAEAGDENAAQVRDEQIDQLLRTYERCSAIGPAVDVYLASLEWLQQAADLGHLGAQRLYHYYARVLIAQDPSDLIFRRPELIREFQLRADRYAQALLERDHPQGLLLMARMLNVGDVYPKDQVMAYAYARAAEMTFSGALKADAEERRVWVARSLSPDQILEAEDKALELAAARD